MINKLFGLKQIDIKVRLFITLSLLCISFSSFAVMVTCPSPEDLNKQLVNETGAVRFEPIGPMTVRVARSRLKNLVVEEWREIRVFSGFLSCGYSAPSIPGLVTLTANARGWKGGDFIPWYNFACSPETTGTRETCVARSG